MALRQSVRFLKQQTLAPSEESIVASQLRLAQANAAFKGQAPSTQLDQNRLSASLPSPDPKDTAQVNKPQAFSGLLRRARALKEKQQKASKTGAALQGAEQLAGQAVSTGTSELLQQAWYNAVESYGLTILYVNVHVFLHWVLGEKYFCKLGHEWLGGKKSMKIASGNKWGGASQSILGVPEAGLGYIEGGIVVIVDVIVLVLLLIIVAFVVLLAWMIQNPKDALWEMGFGSFWQMIKVAWSLSGK